MTDPAAFRSEFPVLERVAYLNAGTDGPLPRRAAEAIAAVAAGEAEGGRSGRAFFEARAAVWDDVRARLAGLLGAPAGEVALTASTSDGMNTVIWGFELGPGDQVVTSDEEHPGLLAPLAEARRKKGFEIVVAPLAEVANAVGPATRLVACSHVSWVGGALAPVADLAKLEVPVLLDGAQALGSMALDVGALGCDFYAGPGQKWLCGPDSTGALWVRPDRVDGLGIPWPSYVSLGEPGRPLDLVPHPGARRFDGGVMAGPVAAGWRVSLDLLAEAGWEWVHSTAARQAELLRELLAERDVELAPGGPTTLVSWRSADPAATVARLAEAGIVVREIPGRGLVRASVGAWSSDGDLERLAAAV